jgi:hypothetical protein
MTLYIFDYDRTLVTSDYEYESEHLYMTTEKCVDIEVMKDFFDAHIKAGKDVMILSNRSPDLKKELEEKYGVKVICRDYALTKEELIVVNTTDEGLASFIKQMDIFKTSVLNGLARNDDIVYYDDLAHRFKKMNFRKNIVIIDANYIIEILELMKSI